MNLQDIKEKLSKNFLKYGFLPYVYLLEELQEEEQYELCAVVLRVVQEKNIKFDLQLPFECFASVVLNRKLLSAQLSKTLVNRCLSTFLQIF